MNLRSLFVNIPTSFSFSSTTGTPDILNLSIISRASLTVASGLTVTGLRIMPLSDFFTFSTSLA